MELVGASVSPQSVFIQQGSDVNHLFLMQRCPPLAQQSRIHMSLLPPRPHQQRSPQNFRPSHRLSILLSIARPRITHPVPMGLLAMATRRTVTTCMEAARTAALVLVPRLTAHPTRALVAWVAACMAVTEEACTAAWGVWEEWEECMVVWDNRA